MTDTTTPIPQEGQANEGTGAQAIFPPEFPAMPALLSDWPADKLWLQACLTGWRCGFLAPSPVVAAGVGELVAEVIECNHFSSLHWYRDRSRLPVGTKLYAAPTGVAPPTSEFERDVEELVIPWLDVSSATAGMTPTERTLAAVKSMKEAAGATGVAAQPARALPRPGSPEASAMIDSVLAEYGWPANAKNAARAGFEAAERFLAAMPQGEPK